MTRTRPGMRGMGAGFLLFGGLLAFGGVPDPVRPGVQYLAVDPDRGWDAAAPVPEQGVLVRVETRSLARTRRMIEALLASPELPGLPPGLPSRARIDFVPDREQFRALSGGALPEWGAGLAFPAPGVILLPAPGSEAARETAALAGVLRHEWAHLALAEAVPGRRLPRWFDEGYAEWATGHWNPARGWHLRLLLATGRLPRMDRLSLDWPRDRDGAEIAYLLAASAVAWIAEESGEHGLRRIIERTREPGGFDEALRATLGLTPGQFEEAWRRHVRQRYGWAFVASNALIVWSAGALLLLGLHSGRRARDRARLEQLRAADPPDSPEWWMEPDPGPDSTSPSGDPVDAPRAAIDPDGRSA